MSNYSSERCTVLKIFRKTCLVMITILSLHSKIHEYNCNTQSCFVYPNGLTDNELLNLDLWSDESSNETENFKFEK